MKRQSLALLSARVLPLVGVAGTPMGRPTQAAMASPGRISIVSLAPGTVVTGNSITAQIAVKNLTINCARADTTPSEEVRRAAPRTVHT